MRLYCDNKSAINISHNFIQHECTKHIEIDWKRHKDLLIDKNKYKRRMRNPPAKES